MSDRHVTLCVTHPGGAGHLTLDHHVPEAVAQELERRVDEAYAPGWNRYVTLIVSPGLHAPALFMEVSDDTADALVAWLLPHMPPHVQDALR